MMTEQTVEQVAIAKVKPAPDNPRQKIGDVTELAMTMREVGVLEPILATRVNGGFQVVAGARRRAAAALAGLETVPIIVRDFTEEQRLLAMTAENLQREDLTPVDEARAYQALLETLQISQHELAPKVGKTQSHISKRLGLLSLPKDVQAKVDSGGIAIADALELGKLAEHPARLKAALNGPGYQSLEIRVRHELAAVEREKKIVRLEEEIESKGFATRRVQSQWQLPKGVHPLKGASGSNYHALQITAKQHETEPCHAIAIDAEGLGFPVCTNRKNHPKVKTKQEAERAGHNASSGAGRTTYRRAVRRETPEQKRRNEARKARLAFVGQLVAKKPPQAALTLVLRHYVLTTLDYLEGDPSVDRAAIWLGLAEAPEDGSGLLEGVDVDALITEFAAKGDAQLQRAALALAVGDIDDSGGVDAYLEGRVLRGSDVSVSAYLEFLRSQGHPLTDVETKKLAETKAAA